MNSLARNDISTKSSSHKVKWNTTTYQVKQEHDFQILRIWKKKKGNNRSVNYIFVQLSYTNSTQQIFWEATPRPAG